MKWGILRQKVLEWGASTVGFADLKELTCKKWKSLKTGVSIVVRLSDAIIDEVENGPTLTYAYHYRSTNQLLDAIATKVSNFIQSQGYQSLPVPASQTLDTEHLKGLISHKMVATCAGLGWIGKNALLVTPEYGPRVRLASVLTNAFLGKSLKPISESKCGKCSLCVKACPTRALKGGNWRPDARREELMNVNLCHEAIEHNRKILGESICGVCISVCPVGKNHRLFSKR